MTKYLERLWLVVAVFCGLLVVVGTVYAAYTTVDGLKVRYDGIGMNNRTPPAEPERISWPYDAKYILGEEQWAYDLHHLSMLAYYEEQEELEAYCSVNAINEDEEVDRVIAGPDAAELVVWEDWGGDVISAVRAQNNGDVVITLGQ